MAQRGTTEMKDKGTRKNGAYACHEGIEEQRHSSTYS